MLNWIRSSLTKSNVIAKTFSKETKQKLKKSFSTTNYIRAVIVTINSSDIVMTMNRKVMLKTSIMVMAKILV